MKKLFYCLCIMAGITRFSFAQTASVVKSTMTNKDKRQIESVSKMYRGEDKEHSILSKDIIWHMPGHNPVSGAYRGIEAYTKEFPAKMAPLTKWKFTVEHIMVNGDYVTVSVVLDGERKGKKANMKGIHLLRFNEEGKIAEGWGFMENQDALDEFFTD